MTSRTRLHTLTASHPAVQFLKFLQTEMHYPEAIIAGGAIRDTYLQTYDPTDWDIYIKSRMYPTLNVCDITSDLLVYELDMLFGNFKTNIWEKEWETNDLLATRPKLPGSLSGCDMALGNFQIDGLAGPISIICTPHVPKTFVSNRFTVDLCKGYCDGKKVHISSEMKRDIINNTITCDFKLVDDQHENIQNMWLEKHVFDHLVRVHTKYPNFKVCISSRVDGYLTQFHLKQTFKEMFPVHEVI